MNPNVDREAIERTERLQEVQQARPFYIVLILALVVFYGWALTSDPFLRSSPQLARLTSLFLIHGALHWGSMHLALRPRWIYPYFILQCLIIFMIVLTTAGQEIMLMLYLVLVGEAVSVFRDPRRSAPVVGGILLLTLIAFSFFHSWSRVQNWLLLIVPMALFIVVYITMFGLQARSRAEAQRLLHELETAHHQLAEYATEVEDLTLVAERRRMARELHDTLAQGLAGLILQLEAADSYLSKADAEKAGQIIRQAMGRARATLEEARQAIDNLRTGPLSSNELEEAVRTEAGRFTDATGIPCNMDLRIPTNLPAPLAENALRAISEGLANVARHAKASQAWLSLHSSGDAIEIRLGDNGVGFDPTTVAARGGHYGLIGLRERSRISGGSMEVQSALGEGTVLAVRLPIEEEESP